MDQETQTDSRKDLNLIGLGKADYRGGNTTLCQGCGHNSISSQIIQVCYELSIPPEKIIKFSGIGCSSKSPAYFLNRSFGFNGLHGRMPALATGAMMADHTMRGIGVSGDGDTASIGMGQFKHLLRRNLPLVYVVENNGVYGLTKGQFSATAEKGLKLKSQGTNPYMPVDICWEALVGNATFIARSFAGDPKQVRELFKAAFSHHGVAVLDIISPCVTFNNNDDAMHSYAWGKEHEVAIHELSYVPPAEEILVEYEAGETKEVVMHDGSIVLLKKLAHDHDPFDRAAAMRILEEANAQQQLLTGLIYINTDQPALDEIYNLPAVPLNRLTEKDLRPDPGSLTWVNEQMF
jgi:2-oxoglutarate ferredoxin oxidoreductase subunit beta